MPDLNSERVSLLPPFLARRGWRRSGLDLPLRGAGFFRSFLLLIAGAGSGGIRGLSLSLTGIPIAGNWSDGLGWVFSTEVSFGSFNDTASVLPLPSRLRISMTVG